MQQPHPQLLVQQLRQRLHPRLRLRPCQRLHRQSCATLCSSIRAVQGWLKSSFCETPWPPCLGVIHCCQTIDETPWPSAPRCYPLLPDHQRDALASCLGRSSTVARPSARRLGLPPRSFIHCVLRPLTYRCAWLGLFVRLLDLTCGFSMDCLFRYWLLGGHLHAARAVGTQQLAPPAQPQVQAPTPRAGLRGPAR